MERRRGRGDYVFVRARALACGVGVPCQVSTVGVPHSSRLWRARDAMERGRWLLAMERAAAAGISATLADEVRRCGALRERVAACADRDGYARVLAEQFSMAPLLVSMAWVRRGGELHACVIVVHRANVLRAQVESVRGGGAARGTNGAAAGTATETSSDMTQLFKDLQRDSVVINGVLLRGADGVGAVVAALARRVYAVLHGHGRGGAEATPRGGGSESARGAGGTSDAASARSAGGCTDADALAFARDVLLMCNRTTSGGDAYEAATALFERDGLSFVCPLGREARPLRFDVAVDAPSLPHVEPASGEKAHHDGADNSSDSGSEDESARSHGHRRVGSEGSDSGRRTAGGVDDDPAAGEESARHQARLAPSGAAAVVTGTGTGVVVRFEAVTQYKIVDMDPQDEEDSVFGTIALTLVRMFS